MIYTLSKLNYSYNSLEPYIDAKTMEVHHSKHHQTYTDKLNTVLEKYPELQDKKIEDILRDFNNLKINEIDKKMIKNNGGGYINHNLFWEIMAPEKQIDQLLVSEIEKTFESIENFKKIFSEIAAAHFGSGWAWLVRDDDNKLRIYSLPNQDSPYSEGHTPIIGLDIWEHAYYLKYQNKRSDYIDNWWLVLKLI